MYQNRVLGSTRVTGFTGFTGFELSFPVFIQNGFWTEPDSAYLTIHGRTGPTGRFGFQNLGCESLYCCIELFFSRTFGLREQTERI